MNWELVIDPLIKAVILSFFIERALAVIFEMEKVEPHLKKADLKPAIAILVSVAACYLLEIDAVGPLKPGYSTSESSLRWLGYGLTGLVVAGGSAGAVKLFQDVLGFRRAARDQLKAVADLESKAEKAEAEARLEQAIAKTTAARADQIAVGTRLMVSTAIPGAAPERQILAGRIAERRLRLLRGT